MNARLLLCLLAAALIVGGTAVSESRSQSHLDSAERFSTKGSGCGRVPA